MYVIVPEGQLAFNPLKIFTNFKTLIKILIIMNFSQLQCLVGTFRSDLVNFMKVMCDFCHIADS